MIGFCLAAACNSCRSRPSAALIGSVSSSNELEEGLSTFQFLCKPHPCLGKIGEMLS